MHCRDVRKAIPALLDGALSYDREFAVRQHLNGCPDCHAVFQRFQQDERALSGYMRQAPYAPVARDVIEQIERQRSPWRDAFMAGSYRLASIAGLVLVLLVVGAGAWMLREVATSDQDAVEQPTQEIMVGTSDQDDSIATEDDEGEEQAPAMIGMDDVEVIVERLDDAGLVFIADLQSEGDGYRVEYGRVAIDRHLTLVEYNVSELSEDARLMVGAFGRDGGGGADFSDGRLPRDGWLVLPAINPESDYIELQDGVTIGENALNSHQVDVDLTDVVVLQRVQRFYDVADTANGLQLCCLLVEPGIAVSTITWDWNIISTDDLEVVDEDLQPVDTPPLLDSTVEPVYPSVRVEDEPYPVLELDVGQALTLEGNGVGVFGLPAEGVLEVEYDFILLPRTGEETSAAIYRGPWTLTAELEDVVAEPEPTPEPTVPPDAAEEPMPTPEPEPEPTPVPEDDDDDVAETLRVLIYLVRGEEIGVSSREIGYTQDVATASIEALLAGPDYQDEDAGLHSEIPQGTELLDISLSDGTLTVDLSAQFADGGGSASMLMRVAQVVHTGTQFGSISEVQILIEGEEVEALGGEGIAIDEPMDRDEFEDQAPAILIETPAPHETVGSEIRLRGTSNTFEANLQIEIIDPAGNQVYRDYATATSGTGTRGEFDLSISVDSEREGMGELQMFEHSARDGSRTNVVTIPVWFE
jgi:germination protein M